MMEYFHSVMLDEDKCTGCTNCVKRCPTEAIRVKDGKAHIIAENCIDCGECIRICKHHAKKAVFDKLSDINDFEYKIALPAPSLYGQFNNLENIDLILSGLLKLGFDDVFEVARAAELSSEITRRMLELGGFVRPVISTACPAVVRMIRVRFPKLITHLHALNPPVEIAAKIARDEAMQSTGLSAEKIGIFFISPCPAKVTAARQPLGNNKKCIDRVLSVRDVYQRLLPVMKELTSPLMVQRCGITGISWSYTGGEATALLRSKYLAADGMENVINVLEEIEDEKLTDVDFVELNACISGCVGGCLNVENPYVARSKIRQLRKYLPVSENRLRDYDRDIEDFTWNEELTYKPIMQLSADRTEAMQKMQQVHRIEEQLPGVDCAACGAPSCVSFACDVVMGKARLDECIFVMRNKLEKLNEILNGGESK